MQTAITLTSKLNKTARVAQIAGMFDYELTDTQTLTWQHNLPFEDKQWNVGLIVGASGAGKSVLAHKIWGDLVKDTHDWDDNALIDNFPKDVSINEITATLTAVGFGTVPAWLRPYKTLSNGEKFRADMARSIIEAKDVIVIDEFTSVVDRQVAKIASNAVAKTVRRANKQFVAVTCHYDITEWLQPDWIYDLTTNTFSWEYLRQRPQLELKIYPTDKTTWSMFARHHYLSADLHNAAKCFIAYIDDTPVAFTSYIHFPHAQTRNIKMGHRLVVLPDFQGLGIASRLEDWLGDYLYKQGFRYRNVVAHPAMIRLYTKSPRWRATAKASKAMSTGKNSGKSFRAGNLSSRRLAVQSFEYTPAKAN